MSQKELALQVKQKVDLCVENQKSYGTYRTGIVQKVRDNDKLYVKPVIDHIYTIISTSGLSGLQKFLALHLWKEILDTRNADAVNHTASKYLKKLSKTAESLSKTKTTEERARVLDVIEYPQASGNFQALVLECLMEWATLFQDVNKDYNKIYAGLVKKKVTFPSTKKYFKSKEEKAAEAAATQQKGDVSKSTTTKKLAESSSSSRAQPASSKGNQALEAKANELLSTLEEYKGMLVGGVSQPEKIEKDVLVMAIEGMKSTNGQLQAAAPQILGGDLSGSIADQYLRETSLSSSIIQSYDKYTKETKNYNNFKKEVLDLVSKSQAEAAQSIKASKAEESKASGLSRAPKNVESKPRSEASVGKKSLAQSSASNVNPAVDSNFNSVFDSQTLSNTQGQPSANDPFSNFQSNPGEAKAETGVFASFITPVVTKQLDNQFGGWDDPNAGKSNQESARAEQGGANFGAFQEYQADPRPSEGEKKTFGFDAFGNFDKDIKDFDFEAESNKGGASPVAKHFGADEGNWNDAGDNFGFGQAEGQNNEDDQKGSYFDRVNALFGGESQGPHVEAKPADDFNKEVDFWGGAGSSVNDRPAKSTYKEPEIYEEIMKNKREYQQTEREKEMYGSNAGFFNAYDKPAEEEEYKYSQPEHVVHSEETPLPVTLDPHVDEYEKYRNAHQEHMAEFNEEPAVQQHVEEHHVDDYRADEHHDNDHRANDHHDDYRADNRHVDDYRGDTNKSYEDYQVDDHKSQRSYVEEEKSQAYEQKSQVHDDYNYKKATEIAQTWSFQPPEHPAEIASPQFQSSWDNNPQQTQQVYQEPEKPFSAWDDAPANDFTIEPKKAVADDYDNNTWGVSWDEKPQERAPAPEVGSVDRYENELRHSQSIHDTSARNIDIPHNLGHEKSQYDMSRRVSAEHGINHMLTSQIQPGPEAETEKVREERDKVMNDLENVRKMYAEMKAQFDKMRNEQSQIANNYGKVHTELSTLKQVNREYGSEFKKLRSATEEQHKIKTSIRQENEHHLKNSQRIAEQITDLKEQLAASDSKERRIHLQAKINELEKQMKASQVFLKNMDVLLEISEKEEQDHLRQIADLHEQATKNMSNRPTVSDQQNLSPAQRTPSPTKGRKEESPEKPVDELQRLKQFDNPTLISAANLLKASRMLREQDTKTFASGKIPKPTDTPIRMKKNTPARDLVPNLVLSRPTSPTREETTTTTAPSTFKSPIYQSGFLGTLNLNQSNILTGSNPAETNPVGTSQGFPIKASTITSPRAAQSYESFIQKLRENSTVNQYTSPAISKYQPGNYSTSQFQSPAVSQYPKPEVNNPVLSRVSAILEQSKRIRFDQTKIVARKEANAGGEPQKYNFTYGENQNGIHHSQLLSPRLGNIDINRGHFNANGESVYARPFGARDYRTPTDANKMKNSQLLAQNEPNPRAFSIKDQNNPDANDSEDTIASNLRRINLKSSRIALKSSRHSALEHNVSKKHVKVGRFVSFDSYTAGKITEEVERNPHLKDLDSFKYACLAAKAALFDSETLQIGVISKMDKSANDAKIHVLLHYGNKTTNEMFSFSVSPASVKDATFTPDLFGIQIASRYQLKQEFAISFSNFKFTPYFIQLTFMHNGTVHNYNVPIPFSLVKFMEFKYISPAAFKERWRALKTNCIKLKDRRPNSKFFKDQNDLNRFFSGMIVDIRSITPRTQKMKYGGFFVLPDGHEYFVKFIIGNQGCKISIATDSAVKSHAEAAIQQIAFLLTN